jgi:hypothetical protein
MNVDALTKSLISSRWLALSLAALFFVSVPDANADPVGDFVKKFGQSVSKAFQPRPTPNPTEKKTRHVSQRPSSRNRNPVQASPTPIEQPTNPVQEEKVTPPMTVMRASAVPMEKAKVDLPYGIPVPGHKGMVTSPYLPEGSYIDVTGFSPGSAVRDPYTGKMFLVP